MAVRLSKSMELAQKPSPNLYEDGCFWGGFPLPLPGDPSASAQSEIEA
jgi:hypothetical protein